MKILKQFTLMISLLAILIGCSDDTTDTVQNDELAQWNANMQTYVIPNATNLNRKYDYYEIANGQIVHTSLNMDTLNVLKYFTNSDPSYQNELYEINTQYNITNSALDINKTVDAMIFNSYDILTKITEKTVYIRDFGIYEISKNFCTINSSETNCSSFLYIRY